MKKDLDYEKLRHTIEKIEAGLVLNKEEEVYSDIIRSLTEKKRTQIKIDVNFKDSLKKELLSEYSLLYEKSRAVNGFLDIWKFSFLRFAVSYSMFFVLTFTFYNGILNQDSKKNFLGKTFNSEIIKDKSVNEEIASDSFMKSEKAAPMGVSNSTYSRSPGISFGADKVSNDIKGSSDDPIQNIFALLTVALVSLFISILFSFKRKKPKS